MPVNKFIEKMKLGQKDWRAQSRRFVINREVVNFGKIFKENFTTLIISAFGLVAALSWNEAIKEAINTLLPQDQAPLVYKLYAAILITIISIGATYFLSKFKSNTDSK